MYYIFLQVLYHVLGVIPAYQASIGPALNELCLGLQPDEVAPVCVVLSVVFLLLFVLIVMLITLSYISHTGSGWDICEGHSC